MKAKKTPINSKSKLREVVAPQPSPLKPASSVKEAGEKMRVLKAEKFPVADGDKLIGTLQDQLADRHVAGFGHDPLAILVKENMSADVVFCRAGQSVQEAIQLMKSEALTHLPVVDEDSRLIGIVSLKDLMRKKKPTATPKESLKKRK